jgi:hypothetical protein
VVLKGNYGRLKMHSRKVIGRKKDKKKVKAKLRTGRGHKKKIK